MRPDALRRGVHPGAPCEVLRGLRAAVQHDDHRRIGDGICGHIDAVWNIAAALRPLPRAGCLPGLARRPGRMWLCVASRLRRLQPAHPWRYLLHRPRPAVRALRRTAVSPLQPILDRRRGIAKPPAPHHLKNVVHVLGHGRSAFFGTSPKQTPTPQQMLQRSICKRGQGDRIDKAPLHRPPALSYPLGLFFRHLLRWCAFGKRA